MAKKKGAKKGSQGACPQARVDESGDSGCGVTSALGGAIDDNKKVEEVKVIYMTDEENHEEDDKDDDDSDEDKDGCWMLLSTSVLVLFCHDLSHSFPPTRVE